MKFLDEFIKNPFDIERFKKFADMSFADRDQLADEAWVADDAGVAGQACDDELSAGQPAEESVLSAFSAYISDFHMKRYKCSEGAEIAVLTVRMCQDAVDGQYDYIQRKLLFEILACMRCEAAVAAFYYDGVPEWKLSFGRHISKSDMPYDLQAENGSGLRRVSFTLGSGGRRGTSFISRIELDAVGKQLLKLIRKKEQISLKSLEKAFSCKIFSRNIIRSFGGRYHSAAELSELAGLPDFTMYESDPYDRILAVNPEILGNLFESRFDRAGRKNSGTFYTPSEIVGFMCRESLAQYISNAVELPYADCLALLYAEGYSCDSQARMAGEPVSCLPVNISRSLSEIDQALKQVRIFDPAAGSGAFVLGMLKEIVKARITVSSCFSAGMPDHPYMLALHAVRNCIFAADIDEEAVRMTRLRLWCALASFYTSKIPGLPGLQGLLELSGPPELPGLPEFPGTAAATGSFCNIICGNSLVYREEMFKNQPAFANVFPENGGFDIVVGNPPYISAVEDARYGNLQRQSLKSRYPVLKGSFDIYTAFLIEGVSQLNKNGVYCWIVPNSLLSSRYAAPVLEYLGENGLKRSISVSDLNVFHNVGVYPVIVVGNKNASGGGYGEYIAASDGDPQHVAASGSYGSQRYEVSAAIGTFKGLSLSTFKDFGIRFASGAAGFQAKALAAFITEKRGDGAIPFVVSGSIDKYTTRLDNVRYMGKTYERAFITKGGDIAQSKWDLWLREKIVIAGLTRELEADYSGEPLALGVGAYALYDFGGFDPLFLLGLLNSRFMSEYINEQFHEKHLAGGYLAINKSTLEQLPLVPAGQELQKTIAEKAAGIRCLMRQYRRERSNAGRTGNKRVSDPEPPQLRLERESLLKDMDELVDKLYSYHHFR